MILRTGKISRSLQMSTVMWALIAGPAFAQGYLSAIESNKKVVFDYYRLVVEPRNADLVELYVAEDSIDHDSSEKTGRDAVVKMLKALGAPPSDDVGATLRNPPAFVMAEGDLVTYMFRQTVPDPQEKSKMVERFSLEVYRIKDRKIVEHWKGVANVP